MNFNPSPSTVMHVDINSCFATIEQQANPNLREKPVVVAAYTTNKGCILASSVEAKKRGIKTGMPVGVARGLYPPLTVLPPDPEKYRFIHLKLKKLLLDYTTDVTPKSIDEFVLNFKNYPILEVRPLKEVAQEIKGRIKSEIGDWITVSVGIAPNRYLAKIAAGLTKPDGLDEINKNNFESIYKDLKLTDLTGIKNANAARLNSVGIYSVLDFYNAPIWSLKAAFHSIAGHYWHERLRGYEVDDTDFARKSYGNSIALGANLTETTELAPILSRLCEKMSARLRAAGYKADGIHLMIVYKDRSAWHKGALMARSCFDSRDFYKAAFGLLSESQAKNSKPRAVLNLAVTCFKLSPLDNLQLNIFEDEVEKSSLVDSIDTINEKWGNFTAGSARGMGGAKIVLDRIAFGGVKELS